MSIKITEECINCGACEPECPNNAIYEGGMEWRMRDGITATEITYKGKLIEMDELQKPLSTDFFYIVSEKCTECVGFYEEPQCISVCPVDCCVADEHNEETHEELIEKKENLYKK